VKPRGTGNLLRRGREALALSQRALAARVGVSAAYISFIEIGKRVPSFSLLARLATTLDMDMQVLGSIAYPEFRELFDGGDRNKPTPKLEAWLEFVNSYQKRHRVSAAEQRILFAVNKLGRVKSARDFVHIITAIRLSLEK
jgi:transcriptional regulator with XRE-family HTH domain